MSVASATARGNKYLVTYMPCEFPGASKQLGGCLPSFSTCIDSESESVVVERDDSDDSLDDGLSLRIDHVTIT